jgi:hypothetical protein
VSVGGPVSARDEQTPQSRPPADAPVQAPGHGPGHQPAPAANGATDHRNGVPTAPLYGSPAAPRQPGFPLWIVPLVLLPLLVAVAWIFGSRWRAEQALQRETAALSATATASPAQAQPQPTPPPATPVPPASGVVIVETLQYPDPVRGEEVLDAVEQYWRVLADAVYYLDPSDLPTVASGKELERLVAHINSLRSGGVAIYPIIAQPVSQAFRIRSVETDIGVRVRYINQSYTIDENTKEPMLPPGATPISGDAASRGEEQDVFFLMDRATGSWKVIRSFGTAVLVQTS